MAAEITMFMMPRTELPSRQLGQKISKTTSKKQITCYKCKKTGHYSNKYDEELTVKMSNKNLILKDDVHYSSSEDEHGKI